MVICKTESSCKCSVYSYYMHHLFIVVQDGTTPLYVASQNGHTNVVDVLLRHGADPNLAKHVSIEVVY